MGKVKSSKKVKSFHKNLYNYKIKFNFNNISLKKINTKPKIIFTLKSILFIIILSFSIFKSTYAQSYNWSVQSGSVSSPSTLNSFSVNINPITLNQSFVLFKHRMANSYNTPLAARFFAQFPNTTSVLFTRNGTGIVNIEYYIISSDALYTQQGTMLYTNSQNSINTTIFPMNQNHTIVVVDATCNSNSANDWHETYWMANLSNSTNLFLRRNGASACSGTVGFFAVEFNDNSILQQGEIQITEVSYNVTIASVNLSSSFLIFGQTCDATAINMNACSLKANISSSTTLNFERLAATGVVKVYWYVINMPNAKVQSGESGVVTARTYDAALIPTQNTNLSFSIVSVKNSGAATRYSRIAWSSLISSDGSVVNHLRDDNSLNNYLSWQSIELPALNLNSLPIISLNNPSNFSTVNYRKIDFNFTVVDNNLLIDNCTLWSNFTGIWTRNVTVQNVTNNVTTNITLNLNVGNFIWNVQCYDLSGQSSFSNSNYTLFIQNNLPSIKNMQIIDSIGQTNSVDLLVGQKTKVYCNGTASDSDGYLDIQKINATFYNILVSNFSNVDNATNHFTNSSCNFFQIDSNSSNFDCSFDLTYYSLNGTWICNTTIFDGKNKNNNYSFTNVSTLLALNVTSVIEFGNMLVGNISTNDTLTTITNLGNIPLDINLYGYGSIPGDNNSMICTVGYIPSNYTKYNFTSEQNYLSMISLTGNITGITYSNFDLFSQSSSSLSTKNIYWKTSIPFGVRGQCIGTVVFSAIKS